MYELFSMISDLEQKVKAIYLSFFYTVLYVGIFLFGAVLEYYFPVLFVGVW